MAAFFVYGCPVESRLRTIVYVDGFNLYYGAVKDTKHKWLDLQRFFVALRQHDDVVAIKYFTAIVKGSGEARQSTYLSALATCPLVEVILGRFKPQQAHQVPFNQLPDASSNNPGRFFPQPEEKRTDVNIAVKMIEDAYENNCDNFVLVSGDSDLVSPVTLIRTRFPDKKVIVYVPARADQRGAAVELRTAAHANKSLPLEMIRKMQFPGRVPSGSGSFIVKPNAW